MGLIMAVKLLETWYPPDEFKLVTIYGGVGYGKSAYAFKVGVETLQHIYKVSDPEAWELLKQFIIFHPEQFFNKLDDIVLYRLNRVPFLIWDDAGLWLYALDWNDPFVKRTGKYMNVARTHVGFLEMTTPSPEYIFSKIRKFPNAYLINIVKRSGQADPYRRLAKPYLQYYNIVKGYRRTSVKMGGARVEDEFSCLMPDPFYAWYKPLRDAYEDMALDLMKQEWRKLKIRSNLPDPKDYPHLAIPPLTLRTT